MKITILTLFPQIFESVFSDSIIKRAQDKNLVEIRTINIRDFARDKHKTVDDKPYGGGGGMVLKADVVVDALESVKPKPYSILLSASGRKFNQKLARSLSKEKNLAIICGHYEGVDVRVEKFVDEILSIGDFILTGGEIPAMAIVDSITRLIPGTINKNSLKSESFSQLSTLNSQLSTLIEYPQYTRPEVFRNKKVPQVLLCGNHQLISKWRKTQAVRRTQKFRPDLLSQDN